MCVCARVVCPCSAGSGQAFFHGGESVVSVRPNGKNHENETKIAKEKQRDIKSKTLTQSQGNVNFSNKG